MEKDYIILNDKKIEYYFTRKKIKNLILKINKDGNIILSIPKKTTKEDVYNFIKKEYKWILKKQTDVNEYKNFREENTFEDGSRLYYLGKMYYLILKKDKNNSLEIRDNNIILKIKERYIFDKKYIEKEYKKFLKEKALTICLKYVDMYYNKMKKYDIPYPEVQIKDMKSKWGYCTPSKKKIVFSLNLIKTDIKCVEYVVVHELAHFKYQNHSKNFYNFIKIFLLDWKIQNDLLNKKYTKLI